MNISISENVAPLTVIAKERATEAIQYGFDVTAALDCFANARNDKKHH